MLNQNYIRLNAVKVVYAIGKAKLHKTCFGIQGVFCKEYENRNKAYYQSGSCGNWDQCRYVQQLHGLTKGTPAFW
jgi:hypothetical protein